MPKKKPLLINSFYARPPVGVQQLHRSSVQICYGEQLQDYVAPGFGGSCVFVGWS